MSTKFTNDQLDAILHNGSDLIISAAAGSGKTATLTERIIRKIKAGADISKMLIVTFTKAAAGELKNKISRLIGNELKNDPKNVHLSTQLVKSSYADICTIDSFCMKLVRPNFDKLALDGGFRLGDTGEISMLENQVMEELIDELYENERDDSDFLLVADCYFSIWNEQELAKALLDLREKLLTTELGLKTLLKTENYNSDFLKTPHGKIILTHLNEVIAHFTPIIKEAIEILSKCPKGKDNFVPDFQNDLSYLESVADAISSDASYDKLRAIISHTSFVSLSKCKLDEEYNLPYYRSVHNALTKEFKSIIEDYFSADEEAVLSSARQNGRICRAIYNILVEFEGRLLAKKRLFSVYSFNDISTFALSLLYENDEPSALARDIASKYDEIYIDEYQDTNSMQDKIFRAIAKNNRFMVGDIKQSIYRFRSAEPEIFSYYRENFTKSKEYTEGCLGKSIFMSTNFRCDKNIIDFSNLVSNYMFKNSIGIPYAKEDELQFPSEIKDSSKDKITEIHLLDGSEIEEKKIEVQADYVARRIKKMIDSEHLPNGKKITASDIAILLRFSTKQIPFYVEALKRYGIDSMYQSGDAFFEKPHIMLVLCILNILDNPSRDIYLAGALRSDVFNFSLEDLVKIKGKGRSKESLYSMLKSYEGDADLREKIDNFLTNLENLRNGIKRLASNEVLYYVYSKCGLFSICSSQEKADFMKLYNIAREYEKNSFKGLFSFLKYIDDLASDYDSTEFNGDATKENVKLMSIHASKGLEFEVCFICGTETNFVYFDLADDLLFQREMGVAGFVGQKDGLVRFNPLVRKCIALKKNREMHEEEMRILYVAMTRAKSHLIITGCLSNPRENREKMAEASQHTSNYSLYKSGSELKYILGATCEENPCYAVTYVDNPTKEGDAADSCEAVACEGEIDNCLTVFKNRFDFKYKYDYLEKIPSKMSVSRLDSNVLDNPNTDIDIPELSSVPKFLVSKDKDEQSEAVTGAQIGIATHVFMQYCDFKRLKEPDGIKNELNRLVDEFYMTKEDSQIVSLSKLEDFVNSSLFDMILKAKDVIREFRFNIMLDAKNFTTDERLFGEKVLVQGVTDCILENDDGTLTLIDYKTDYVTRENYESYLKRNYTKQLSYYRDACQLIFDKPVSRTIIYSITVSEIVDI